MAYRRTTLTRGRLAILTTLAVVGVAVAGCGTDDDPPDIVGAAPPAVWLDRSGGIEVESIRMGAPSDDDSTAVVLAPSDATDEFARMLFVEVSDREPNWADGESFTVDDRSGVYSESVFGDRGAVLHLRHDGDLPFLHVWGAEGTSPEVLAEVAAMVDPTRPIDDQSWGSDWSVVSTDAALNEYDLHRVTTTRMGGPAVEVSTVHTTDDSIVAMRADIYLAESTRVRDRDAVMIRYESDSRFTFLTWLEEPGFVVSVVVIGDPDLAPDQALAIAEQLEVLGEEAWEELVARDDVRSSRREL